MSVNLLKRTNPFLVDNFSFPTQTGNAGQTPVRLGSQKKPGNQMPVMDQNSSDMKPKTETKSEKPDTKDFRSDPPGKIKLPGLHKPPVPPPAKEKPIKLVPKNVEESQAVSPRQQPPASPVQKEVKETKDVKEVKDTKDKTPDQFDGVDVSSEKLSHPTANRAKPPQRRPPTALTTVTQVTEPQSASPAKTDQGTKSTEPLKTQTEGKAGVQEETASLASVLIELKDLRMSLDLLKAQHERDINDLKDELKGESEKRMRLQDEVEALRKK